MAPSPIPSSPSPSSSPTLNEKADTNAQVDEEQHRQTINPTSMATKNDDGDDDGKSFTLQHHDDETSETVASQLQPTNASQMASGDDKETPHKPTKAALQSDDKPITPHLEPTESVVASTVPNHATTKVYSGASQTGLISSKEGATTQATEAVAELGSSLNQSGNKSALSYPERADSATIASQHGQATDRGERRSSQRPPLSLVHEYLVKSIDWLDPSTNTSRVVRIITQNENGPCPLVSICNVLFIRGDLHMRPFERTSVTFEYLLEILGDYLLNHAPSDIKTPESPSAQQFSSSPPTLLSNQDQESKKSSADRQTTTEYVLTYRHNLDTALTILPRLQTGLDVNVQFSSIHDFEPTEELALFDLFGVDLVHGWIIDPQDEEGYRVINKCKSYNGIVECIVRGAETNLATNNNNSDKGEEIDETKMATRESNIHDGLVASQFLEDSATQLTYYGIELLTDTLPKNKLCVLFRNNHFSTLYKHPISDRLYTLVTDSGLVSEENIVWETLGDVDQGTSEFVTSQFARPPPTRIGPTSRAGENQDRETADLDYAIALSLQQHQHEEIARTSQVASSRSSSILSPNHRIRTSDSTSPTTQPHTPLLPKKKGCIIS